VLIKNLIKQQKNNCFTTGINYSSTLISMRHLILLFRSLIYILIIKRHFPECHKRKPIKLLVSYGRDYIKITLSLPQALKRMLVQIMYLYYCLIKNINIYLFYLN